MIDLRKVNHPEFKHVRNRNVFPKIITNQDIFDAIAFSGGYDKRVTEKDIAHKAETLNPGEFHFIGTMMAESLWVDYTGRFRIGTREELQKQWGKERVTQDLIERKQRELVESPRCKHKAFVARDISGDNKFICRECGERFKRHPSLAPEDRAPESPFNLPYLLDQFRSGMLTFSQTVKETGMAAEELKKTLKEMFPSQPIYADSTSVDNPSVKQRFCVDTTPVRTSDPEEIENIFCTPGLSLDDLHKIFPDVTDVDTHIDIENDDRIYKFHFVDGSIQKVKIRYKDIMEEILGLYTTGIISSETFFDLHERTVLRG